MSGLLDARPTILGLDLGTTSVGWALFYQGPDGEPSELVDLGVRHFSAVTEPDGSLKNANRRLMRAARKGCRRRRMRRDALVAVLVEAGLLPVGATSAPQTPKQAHPHLPYEIRNRAASERVSLHELAIALLHLGRRRGYRSNRRSALIALEGEEETRGLLAGTDDSDDAPDEGRENDHGKVADSIGRIRDQLCGRTLGQLLYELLQAGDKVRNRYTARWMYEEEFKAIWDCQSKFYPDVLTSQLQASVFDAIFFQRPLKPQSGKKRKCSIFGERSVAAKALMSSQRIRYWQDLSNLKVTDTATGEVKALTLPEKIRAASYLDEHQSVDIPALVGVIGLPKTARLNLPKSKSDKLKGNTTAGKLRRALPGFWDSLGDPERKDLVEILVSASDAGAAYRAVRRKHELTPEQALALVSVELEQGYSAFSAKAIGKILPLMTNPVWLIADNDDGAMASTVPQDDEAATFAEGMMFHEARDAVARQYATKDEECQRIEKPLTLQDIPNPRVVRTLNQLRRVLNAIVRTYGKPDVIRIELSRELKLTRSERMEAEAFNNELNAIRKRQAKDMECHGIQNPTRRDYVKYSLAEQCSFTDPYCGATIEMSQLFGEDPFFEIEHIRPYSWSLDDSVQNLTICCRECNREKANRTPLEAFGERNDPDDPRNWEAIIARVRKFRAIRITYTHPVTLKQVVKWIGTGKKVSSIERATRPENTGFSDQQLNDTKFMSREAQLFVAPLCRVVQVCNGAAVKNIRDYWGLSASYGATNDKDRSDLRHHAVDAVAVAFVSPRLFHRIIATNQQRRPLSTDTVPPAPAWLQGSLSRALGEVNVSHQQCHKIYGPFHRETRYSRRRDGRYCSRRAPGDPGFKIADIVDSSLRAAMSAALDESGLSEKAFLAKGNHEWNGKPVKRIRVFASLTELNTLALKRGTYQFGADKYQSALINRSPSLRNPRLEPTTMIDAARSKVSSALQRGRTSAGSVQEFATRVYKDDTVVLLCDGKYYRVSAFEADGRINLEPLWRARAVLDDLHKRGPVSKLEFQLVSIDVLGRVTTRDEGAV